MKVLAGRLGRFGGAAVYGGCIGGVCSEVGRARLQHVLWIEGWQ